MPNVEAIRESPLHLAFNFKDGVSPNHPQGYRVFKEFFRFISRNLTLIGQKLPQQPAGLN